MRERQIEKKRDSERMNERKTAREKREGKRIIALEEEKD